MKDLSKLFSESMNEVIRAGIKPGNIDTVTINTRAKSRFGQCKYNRNTGNYSININAALLEESVTDVSTKTTIIHEILHTCRGCMNHGAQWQNLADVMNRRYGYNIKTTSSFAEKGVEAPKPRQNRYEVSCVSCDMKVYYKRAAHVVDNPSLFRCGRCGGKLVVKSLVPGVEIWTAANKEG